MTRLFLHGVVAGAVPEPRDVPNHLRVASGDLTALATPVPGEMQEAETAFQLALCHHRLLSAYALRHDVLPVRLGTAFSSVSGLSVALARERKAFKTGMERLAGRVEYLLRVRPGPDAPKPSMPNEPADAAATGRDFLARKRAARDGARARAAARSAFARDLADHLARAVVACRPMPSPGADDLARHALLVERDAEAELLRLAEALGHEADTHALSLALRGPGPCYAFSADGVAPGGIITPTEGHCHV